MARVVAESIPPLRRTMARLLVAIPARMSCFVSRMFRAYAEGDASTSGELGRNYGMTRCAGGNEIIQNAIGHCFVERADVSIGLQIKLERLAFNADPVGNVIDFNSGEISLAGHGTKRREIIGFKMNMILPSSRVWKRLQFCLFGRSWNSGCGSTKER